VRSGSRHPVLRPRSLLDERAHSGVRAVVLADALEHRVAPVVARERHLDGRRAGVVEELQFDGAPGVVGSVVELVALGGVEADVVLPRRFVERAAHAREQVVREVAADGTRGVREAVRVLR